MTGRRAGRSKSLKWGRLYGHAVKNAWLRRSATLRQRATGDSAAPHRLGGHVREPRSGPSIPAQANWQNSVTGPALHAVGAGRRSDRCSLNHPVIPLRGGSAQITPYGSISSAYLMDLASIVPPGGIAGFGARRFGFATHGNRIRRRNSACEPGGLHATGPVTAPAHFDKPGRRTPNATGG